MEVDRLSYIFGSFSRRRQSREIGGSIKRRSIEPPKISHDRSKSAPHTVKRNEQQPQRPKSVCNVNNLVDENKFKCSVCQRLFVEPRVLPCLHTFCTRCLEEVTGNDVGSCNLGSIASLNVKTESSAESGQGSTSTASGYVSDKQNTSEETSSPTFKSGIRKTLTCPTCGARAPLPAQGVSSFPLNYVLQHRLVLATLNANVTRLLCDICTSEVKATSRCTECAISLCGRCSEVHRRQRTSMEHEVLSLEESRRKGITRVRRQVMCTMHPEMELTIFCAACFQVVCRECATNFHKGHTCDLASKAAKKLTETLRSSLQNVKTTADQSALTFARLQAASKHLESECNQVHEEVEKFIESYISAVQKHREDMCQQIEDVKRENVVLLEQQGKDLERQIKDARNVIAFVDELLSEGADVEVLTFAGPVLKKLNFYAAFKVPDLKVSNSLQFLPKEVVQNSDASYPLYGVVTKQTVSPKHCYLNLEGLQNLRVGKRAEIILETRDRNNISLGRGGEQITADLIHKDAGIPRLLPVNIEDFRNGTYMLTFTSEFPGKMLLTVNIKGIAIKNSPFPVVVRTVKPHQGTFHCCSFCSSGGNKEAMCGCGGKMPGGYKGCGHGHEGHPGRRHWSCCGSILEHSECTRTNSTHYQITL